MTTYAVAKVPGDGTGPEVVAEAVKVLGVAGQVHGFDIEYTDLDLGGERYLRTKETLTGSDLETLANADAILFGAVGHPQVPPGVLEQDILLRMRRELDQFINLRPVKLHPGVKGPLRDVAKGTPAALVPPACSLPLESRSRSSRRQPASRSRRGAGAASTRNEWLRTAKS